MDGDLDELNQLLKSDYAKSINTFDDMGFTPLMLAAKSGNIKSVRLLIEAGADINSHDESKIGNTALSEVAGEASFEMVEVLVKAGADPNIRGWMQLNALDRAKGRTSIEGRNVFDLLETAAKKFKTL